MGAPKANAGVLAPQALDIRAVSGALFPEILQYRYQQDVLEKVAAVAEHLPQVVQMGSDAEQINFPAIARHMLGTTDEELYTDADMQAIRDRLSDIRTRIQQRTAQINQIMADARVQNTAQGGAL